MLLLVRPADLVVLGISWSGFRLDGTTLEALSDDARLVVIFPPQHLAEEIIDGGAAQAQAQLSGISQVVYGVRGATRIDLTAEGILAGLAAATITAQTEVELPWGLALSPAAASTGTHPVLAVPATDTGDVGLWRTRLSPGAVRPADVRPGADPGFRAPVLSADRTRIVAESASMLPTVRRLELTALGGSLAARGDWDTFKWEQNVASGRDQRVRFAIAGLLYPLGHRAVFTEITERQIGDGPAALRQRRMLAVTEPVRTSAADDPVQRRFPFDEFELTTVRYDDIPDPDVPGTSSSWQLYTRPVPMLDDVRGQLARLQAQAADLAAQVDAEGHRFRPPDELATAGMPEANQLIADGQSLGEKQQTLADDAANRDAANQISSQIDDLQRQIDLLSANDPGSPDLASLEQEVQADVEELRNIPLLPNPVVTQLSGEVQQLQAEVDRLGPIVDAEGHRFRDVNELANDGFQPAIDLLGLQPAVAAAQAKLTELEQIAAQQVDLFFTPPVQFPVRASGRAGDIHFSLPLIFVADFILAPTDDLPGVRSLTDPSVADRLRAAYAASAAIALPGAPIDLVRAADPQHADVHQVHEMTISGTPSEGGFRPQADQFMVALPALRTLLDDPDMLVPLTFRAGFFNPAEEVALKLASSYPAEFGKVPGRTGGLVIPSFTADAISRLNGPVALAGTVRDAAGKLSTDQVFGDTARILGVKISDLIPSLDSPPQIQLQPPNTVTMTWKDVQLADHPPIRTGPTTKLNLTVERSPGHVAAKTLTLVERAPGGQPELTWSADGTTATISLAQAEQATAQVSSYLPDDFLDRFAIRRWLEPGAEAAASGGQHPMVTPARDIPVIHAVRKPLTDPAGTLTAARDEKQTWTSLVPSTALLNINPASTGQVQVTATWDEWTDDQQPANASATSRSASRLSCSPWWCPARRGRSRQSCSASGPRSAGSRMRPGPARLRLTPASRSGTTCGGPGGAGGCGSSWPGPGTRPAPASSSPCCGRRSAAIRSGPRPSRPGRRLRP